MIALHADSIPVKPTTYSTLLSKISSLSPRQIGQEFEQTLAAHLQFRHCISFTSGTQALSHCLRALRLEAGSLVLIPAIADPSVANAVALAGYRPQFADVSLSTGTTTFENIENALTFETRAIVLVNLFGRQALSPEIRELCKKRGIYFIEDARHSFGSPNSQANATVVGFNTQTDISTTYQAGAVLSNDGEMASRLREIQHEGSSLSNHHTQLGAEEGIHPLDALIILEQLPSFQKNQSLRQHVAAFYLQELLPFQYRNLLRLPPAQANHTWSRFVVRIAKNRNGLMRALKSAGIETQAPYSVPLNHQPIWKKYTALVPNAEKLCHQWLELPIFPQITGKQIRHIVQTLGTCLTLKQSQL